MDTIDLLFIRVLNTDEAFVFFLQSNNCFIFDFSLLFFGNLFLL